MSSPSLAEVQSWDEEFQTLHARIAPYFVRAEPRRRALAYLRGLLSPLERKNGWQLAEQVGESTPDGMQRLLNAASWDVNGVRDELRSYAVEQLGADEAVLVVDETSFLKKGNHSVGVKRQYCGTVGHIENCQVGVFLAYATAHGTIFIDRELFLPEEWAVDQRRRDAVGIPEDQLFMTKPQLAQTMLERALDAGVKPAWVTGDSLYSASKLLNALESRRQAYVLAVTSAFLLRFVEEAGLQQARVRKLFAELASKAWQRHSAGQGTQGERVFDWARIRLWDLNQPAVAAANPLLQTIGCDKWLLARRNIDDPREVDYYLVFGPEDTTLEGVAEVAGMRWKIEAGFQALKQETGLDEYETRSWTGWYRHVTFSLLAHALLSVIRFKEAKKGAAPTSSL